MQRLERDLVSQMRGLESPDSEQVEQTITRLVSHYSNEVCEEIPKVSRLRQLQSQLQSTIDQKEQFLAHVLEESADAIMTVDTKRRIVIWNQGAELIFGYRRDEIVGASLERLVPSSRRRELDQIERRTRLRGAVKNRFTRWVTKEGKSLHILLTSTAILSSQGEFAGSSFVIKDFTRQKEMEEAVQHAEQFASLGQLAAGLAHEIKNPLAGIQGAIEVIRERIEDQSQRQILSQVLAEVTRIDKTVHGLLNYAKPKPPQLSPIALMEPLQRMISLLKESSGADVLFLVEGSEAARRTRIRGDGSCLDQVLLNLLLNALEAMDYKGRIRIRLESDADFLVLRVEDSGPGVPMGLRKAIFDPFFTNKPKGTGLGLAICRRIASEHGGTVSLDSEFKQGAAFVLRLPKLGSRASRKLSSTG